MKRSPTKRPSSKNNPGQDVLTNEASATHFTAIGLIMISAMQMVMYFYTGFFPLLLAGMVQLMPALVCLILLIPAPKENNQVNGEAGTVKKPAGFFAQRRNTIVAGLIGAVIVVMHVVYWTAKPNIMTAKLSYPIPVLLAVLFVIAMILDRWCKYSANADNAYEGALLKNLRSALAFSRMILLLLMISVMVNLLGLYDSTVIMKWVIGILLVYASAFLIFALVSRLIRKELDTAPKFVIVMPGIGGSDLSFLPYLEENTGITMRSLWSVKLMKQVAPIAICAVVLLVWLSTGIIQVESHQEAALYRFGKLQDQTLGSGIHLTLPWPFDRTQVYDTESLGTVTIGYVPSGEQDNFWTETHGSNEYRLLLGGGDEMVSINLRIEYRIDDLLQYVTCCAKPESLLEAAAYEIVTARTITADLDTLLSTDREDFSDSFMTEIVEYIDRYNTGLKVVNVNLESIHPPIEVAGVYQDIISAGIEAERMILAAQTEANTKIMNAEKEYTTAVGAALVTKYESVAKAEAAVAEFMASVAADGNYRNEYRYYKYMDALTSAYADAKLILVGEGIDTSNLFIGSIPVMGNTVTDENE